ncbi:glucose PTS transporter subunit IIA [Corynebacterium halotolerans]|uniref:PTS system mannose-specific transporter subunit IIBCA n=1 Tax=Corynebacterium halotolerans YIM 70093 = DSM 44683 TaxID=1121362 RepID=M1P6R6_9CORY|nr:glucose PTS transporter subunit IIA [Corynebacterium halotolerans]AGF72351.1 PTS system mannose-specific transporter subunit IIBCA [Corynebacterium halotolerans YIM 70093 = DSM 44683]
MASKTASTSQHIITEIGGADNVTSLTHCATRLRFQLHDQSKVDVDSLEKDPAVLGVVKQGTTGLQVVMGGGVAEYYQAIMKEPAMRQVGDGESSAPKKKEYEGVRGKYSWVDYSFEFLSDTFRPILWALLGASLIITLLVLADTFGLQDFRAEEQPPTYQFLHAMWNSVFYFLPIFVGATAARKLGANEWVGAAIPAALLTPQFLALGEAGETITVFGLPLTLNDYSSQVFPPLIAAIGLYWVEKGLKKLIPASVQMVFVPFFSLLIMIPATAFLLGPFGIGVGNGISNLLEAIYNFSPFILAIVIPLLYPFLVPLGLHWPLNAIMIQNIATLGYDFIQGPMGAWNFACFGVVAGVMVISLRERNNQMRQVSLGGLMAGLLGGISEPSLYGVLLRFKKTYFRLLPGCFAGGVVMGFVQPETSAFVFTSVLTIAAFTPMIGYTIGVLVAFVTSFLLVIFLDYRGKDERAEIRAQLAAEREAANREEDERIDAAEDAGTTPAPAPTPEDGAAGTAVATAAAPAKEVKPALRPGAVTEIGAPLAGRAIALSEVPDPAFAGGALGQGIAIEPSGDSVVAPADGSIITVQKTGHAVGLRLDNGIEMLIHIGIDTVQMGGEGFEVHVGKKQRVSAGDVLITFDRDAITAAGYPAVTPVLIANTKKFATVEAHPAEHADLGDKVITVFAKQGE